MKNRIAKSIPATLENIEQWHLSRRQFVKGLLIAGALTQIPLLSACTNSENHKNKNKKLPFGTLNQNQQSTLKEIQDILFPNDGNGPSASDINALSYLQWVILDPRMDPSEVEYIINGIQWIEETANENYSKPFLDLSQPQKEQLIEDISIENWGESWLSVILTLIFEALLSDPQYGGNPDSIGWKWLEHYPGYPRPSKDLLYDTIFEQI